MIRLSPDEVQKVLRLAASKAMISPTAGPTVGTVADAFGLQPLQVEALLHEVREREAEAPHWRKLRAIGAAAAVLVLLGISFTAWQSFAGGSHAFDSGTTASSMAQNGPGRLSSYGGAAYERGPLGPGQGGAPTPPSYSAQGSNPGFKPGGAPTERPLLAENRYAKTDATDLSNAREKAKRYDSLANESDMRPMRTDLAATER